jgi:hypothetical protein
MYLPFLSAVQRSVAAVQAKEAAVRPLQLIDSLSDIHHGFAVLGLMATRLAVHKKGLRPLGVPPGRTSRL